MISLARRFHRRSPRLSKVTFCVGRIADMVVATTGFQAARRRRLMNLHSYSKPLATIRNGGYSQRDSINPGGKIKFFAEMH